MVHSNLGENSEECTSFTDSLRSDLSKLVSAWRIPLYGYLACIRVDLQKCSVAVHDTIPILITNFCSDDAGIPRSCLLINRNMAFQDPHRMTITITYSTLAWWRPESKRLTPSYRTAPKPLAKSPGIIDEISVPSSETLLEWTNHLFTAIRVSHGRFGL